MRGIIRRLFSDFFKIAFISVVAIIALILIKEVADKLFPQKIVSLILNIIALVAFYIFVKKRLALKKARRREQAAIKQRDKEIFDIVNGTGGHKNLTG